VLAADHSSWTSRLFCSCCGNVLQQGTAVGLLPEATSKQHCGSHCAVYHGGLKTNVLHAFNHAALALQHGWLMLHPPCCEAKAARGIFWDLRHEMTWAQGSHSGNFARERNKTCFQHHTTVLNAHDAERLCTELRLQGLAQVLDVNHC
jgi:hypothetical protein